MQSAPDRKSLAIIGIKIIAVLLGLNALLSLVVGLMRVFMQDRFPKGEPGIILAGFMIGVAIYFAWLSRGLWMLKNRARIATLVTIVPIFILLTMNLIQNHITPNFKNWWHYYLYPVLFIFLMIPSVKSLFKGHEIKA